jgi:hypothetical protein
MQIIDVSREAALQPTLTHAEDTYDKCLVTTDECK